MRTGTVIIVLFLPLHLWSQSAAKLPDTGQIEDYTPVFGEDSDYLINPPAFSNKGSLAIKDEVTGLIWQKEDGGEMTWDEAISYCSSLDLEEITDWRLPNPYEAFTILDHGRVNPALNTGYFSSTKAQYWWCSSTRADDDNRAWATNSGGGIGPHTKSETISAGGDKKYHVRCVSGIAREQELTDHGNGTISDHSTGLMWQQSGPDQKMTWEEALESCETLNMEGYDDWRLPNVKELQSISTYLFVQPAVESSIFPDVESEPYWASTTMLEPENSSKAWMTDFRFGIVSYKEKTEYQNVMAVRNDDVGTGLISKLQNDWSVKAYVNNGNQITLNYFLDEASPILLSVISLDGKYIYTTNREYKLAGRQKVNLDMPISCSGFYIVILTSSKGQCSTKLFIAEN